MCLHDIGKSSYVLKKLFYEILSRELIFYNFTIHVSFEWRQSGQLFSVWFFDVYKVELKVNLKAVGNSLFWRMETIINVYYSAYFIADYIRRLRNAFDTEPDNYFDGLVTIDGLFDMTSNRKINIYSPVNMERNTCKKKTVRAIEIQNAISALDRVRTEFHQVLNADQKCYVDNKISEFLLYSEMPEIVYDNSAVPIYSAIDTLDCLHKMVGDAGIAERAKVLKGIDKKMLNLNIDMLPDIIHKAKDNKVFFGLVLRLLCISKVIEVICKGDVYDGSLLFATNEYRHKSVSYSQKCGLTNNKLIRDNMRAIGFISKEINIFLGKCKCNCDSGVIHYFC